MTEEPVKRLFVAIDLPPDVRGQLANVLKRMQTGCRFVDCHPKWVSADNLHVTLVFLGYMPEGEVARLSEIITEASSRIAPFELSLDGLDFFPPGSREPRVLSVGVGGDVKQLTRLYEGLAGALSRDGVSVQDRPFRPHLTVARLTSIKTSSRLAPIAQSHSAMLNAKFPVKEVVLFESQLLPDGAKYTEVATAPLLGNAEH